MAAKSIKLDLDLNTKDAQRQVKDLNKELSNSEDSFEDAESAGKQMARAISQAADATIDEIEKTKRAVDALETALDGFDADPTKVVGDLKRMGLTSEEIEADADELAAALRRIDDVKLSAAQAGFDDLDEALGRTDSSGKAASSAIGGVGGSISELPGVSNLGPIAESMGQLAEGALEGEVNMKQLLGAGLALGAVAIVAKGIQGHFKNIADTKAWKKEQVEAYTDAMEDAETAAEGVVNKLAEVEDRSYNLGGGIEFSGEKMTNILNGVGLDIEDVGRIVDGGEERIQAWGDAMLAAGMDADAVKFVMSFLRSELDALNQSQAGAAANAEFLGDSQEDAADSTEAAAEATAAQTEALEAETDALRENIDKLNEKIEAQESLAGLTYTLTEAEWDLEDAVAASKETYADSESTARQKEEADIDVAKAAQNVADAEEDKARAADIANGVTRAATYYTDLNNRSLLDQAATLNGPERQALLDHIALVNGIPDDVMTEINAALDRGDVAEAERLINDTSRTRETALRVGVNQDDLWNIENQLNNVTRTRNTLIRSGMSNRYAAKGTPYATPDRYLVGEEGPEMVDLPMGAKVTPAGKTAEMMGNGAPTRTSITYVTQNFPAGMRPTDVIDAQRKWQKRNGPA